MTAELTMTACEACGHDRVRAAATECGICGRAVCWDCRAECCPACLWDGKTCSDACAQDAEVLRPRPDVALRLRTAVLDGVR